ncbi:DUF6374 family protein [Nocardia cyriacigeorgica]|uniref:DUF6374 family protein n=1 Tax=Nocardia cyriacigeorgica TaxID=135487 RepID=UPI003511F8A6
MPDLRRHAALLRLDQVKAQLLEAAAFGKSISPDQLEMAALKVAEARRVLAERPDSGFAER